MCHGCLLLLAVRKSKKLPSSGQVRKPHLIGKTNEKLLKHPCLVLGTTLWLHVLFNRFKRWIEIHRKRPFLNSP